MPTHLDLSSMMKICLQLPIRPSRLLVLLQRRLNCLKRHVGYDRAALSADEGIVRALILIAAMLVSTACIIRAGESFAAENPAAVSSHPQQQRLTQLFHEKMRDGRAEMVVRAQNEFVEYLRLNSPIAAEKLLNGKMDDDELSSRVDVFLRDRPALVSGLVAADHNDPRRQVADLIRREPAVAGSDSEGLALADRFLERLAQRSPAAHRELLRGSMAYEELQSRVSVFMTDLRTEAAPVTADPKAATVQTFVDSYLKANFGERANDIVYRAEIEGNGIKREYVIFRKRPGKVRMNIVEGGLVVGILGFDGVNAWRQEPGKPGMSSAAGEAAALKQLSRFDDPLVDFRERGTEVKLGDKPVNGLQKLYIREGDGTEMIAAIDPASYREASLRTRQPDGKWRELRFRDYRMLGALNLAYVQEEWVDGVLRTTTRITEAKLDCGLIDQFFVCPANPVFSYMDFMGGLAAIRAQQTQRPPALKLPAGGAQ